MRGAGAVRGDGPDAEGGAVIPVVPVRDEGYWRLRLLLAEIEALMEECGVSKQGVMSC